MTITISEKDSTLIARLLAFLRQEKAVFKIDARSTEPMPNGTDIVWDWSDVDAVSFSKFGLSQIADDWECPEEWAALADVPA